MEAVQAKIGKVSGIMRVALKIIGILLGVFGFLVLAALGILMFSQGQLRDSLVAAYDIRVHSGAVISLTAESLRIIFAFAVLNLALLRLIAHFLYKIFGEMEESRSPFSQKNAVRIKGIAIVSVVLSFVSGFSEALVDYYTLGRLTWGINLVVLLTGVTIYCLAIIFQYGFELQRESDETL